MQKSEIIVTMDYLYSLSCVRFICDKYNHYVNIYHEFEKCDFTLIKIRYGRIFFVLMKKNVRTKGLFATGGSISFRHI